MKDVLLSSRISRFQKVRPLANSTDTSFPSRVATHTPPTGDGVLYNGNERVAGSSSLLLLPYGLGSENDAFSMRIIGWTPTGNDTGSATELWVPVTLLEVSCIIGTSVGVAAMDVLNTERFADTIAIVATSGNPNVSMELISPADNTIGHISLSIKGFCRVECLFDQTTGTPSCNALAKWL